MHGTIGPSKRSCSESKTIMVEIEPREGLSFGFFVERKGGIHGPIDGG